MATNPTLLVQPIAANGAKNVIPNTTSTAGAMSQDQGFPAETALPLGAGGVAPTREDFNGAFNLLSGIAFMAQKGWVFLFDENQDYFAGCTVRDPLDSKIYEAINDVPASSTHPSTDFVNWKLGADMSEYTKTINAPMFNKRDIITTSGTYTAPVTGWYKITAKGGGGGGGKGGSKSSGGVGGDGGGEGGTTIAYVSMTAGDTANVVIGAGGIHSNSATVAAGDGGDTSVTVGGNTYTGGGGGGGISHINNLPAHSFGGSGTIPGCSGCSGSYEYNASAGRGGTGGGAGGATGGNNSSVADYQVATPVANSGGGGGGGCMASVVGSDGADGFAWFEYFDSSLNP